METATIAGVDLLDVGTFATANTGDQTVTAEDLAAAVEASRCPAVGDPIVHIGHRDPRFNSDGEPAVGRVRNLRIAGGRLVGDLASMPLWLGKIVASAYPRRSPETAWDFRCQIGHVHQCVLSGVALLGTGIPAIGSLADLPALFGITASRDGGGGMDRPTDIIASAISRGAISHERAADYQAMADRGEDIGFVADLAGCDVFAAENADIGPVAHRVTAAGLQAAYGGDVAAAATPADKALYEPNPLLSEVRLARPALVSAAMAENPRPPKLFGDRDYPLITASGIDPQVLSELPWFLRRPVAAAPSTAEAYDLIDRFAGDPAQARQDPAIMAHNQPYIADFSAWLSGQGQADTSAGMAWSDAQLYEEIFGSPRPGSGA